MKFKKPYRFEGQDYTEIDLSGLDKLTIQDAIHIQKDLMNRGETAAALVCETTAAFTREVAAKATGMPIEFFQLMSCIYLVQQQKPCFFRLNFKNGG